MTTTDLKTTELISLANSFIDAIKANNLKKTVIPGSIKKIDNISYWKPNENKLENIKELLNAMKDFDNLESFLEHVSLATSIAFEEISIPTPLEFLSSCKNPMS